ncbi:MAG: DMT family transporter [Rhodospirillales bacterium]|nr:DMT family transporter [Rhodospirillales bacterium]
MPTVPTPDRCQLLMGLGCAVPVAILWAGLMVTSRYDATSSLLVSNITLLRFLGSGLVMAPVFWKRRWEIMDAGWPPLPVLSMMGGVPYSLASVGGLAFAPAAQGATVIPGALDVFVALLAWAWIGERPSGDQWLGLGIVLAALALIGIKDSQFGTWQGTHSSSPQRSCGQPSRWVRGSTA